MDPRGRPRPGSARMIAQPAYAATCDPQQAMERVFEAAREMLLLLLPGLRFGEVLRSLLNAAAADGSARLPCRDEARFTLITTALASGGLRPEAVQLAAAIALLELGVFLLDHAEKRTSWTLPLDYSPKLLSLSGSSLLGYLPVALVHALPAMDGGRDRVLADLLQVLARISAQRLEQVEFGRAARAVLIENGPIVRLGVRLRRPSYAILAARLAGVAKTGIENYANFGRSLGIANELRGDLIDLFDDARGQAFISGEITAPIGVYLAQAEPRDRSEMQRLHEESRTSRLARSSLCRRLQRAGVVRQLVATIEEHCARAQEQVDRMHLPPGLERAARNEIGLVSLI